MAGSTLRGTLAGLGLAAALHFAPAPNQALAAASMTIDGVNVTVSAAKTEKITSTADGLRVTVDGHVVTLEAGRLEIDGTAVDAPADITDLSISAAGWSLSVTANHQPVFQLTDKQGLEAAALNGDPVAMNNLGARHIAGRGVDKNVEKALQLYEQAAAKDLGVAFRNLAYVYWIGEHVARITNWP